MPDSFKLQDSVLENTYVIEDTTSNNQIKIKVRLQTKGLYYIQILQGTNQTSTITIYSEDSVKGLRDLLVKLLEALNPNEKPSTEDKNPVISEAVARLIDLG